MQQILHRSLNTPEVKGTGCLIDALKQKVWGVLRDINVCAE